MFHIIGSMTREKLQTITETQTGQFMRGNETIKRSIECHRLRVRVKVRLGLMTGAAAKSGAKITNVSTYA